MSDPKNKEAKAYLDAYDRVWKVYERGLEDHFRRTQILMVVIQSALFLGFIKLVQAMKFSKCFSNSIRGSSNRPFLFLLMLVAVLGALSAWVWRDYIKRRWDYTEFCRFSMRRIECHLVWLGIPLRYYRDEAKVFHDKEHICSWELGKSFPYPGESVKGRQMGLEHGIASFLSVLWGIAFIACLAATGYNLELPKIWIFSGVLVLVSAGALTAIVSYAGGSNMDERTYMTRILIMNTLLVIVLAISLALIVWKDKTIAYLVVAVILFVSLLAFLVFWIIFERKMLNTAIGDRLDKIEKALNTINEKLNTTGNDAGNN